MYQATNKQKKLKKKEKEKRITCAEQDSMKVKRGVKMYCLNVGHPTVLYV
jgi:hypothetical protein